MPLIVLGCRRAMQYSVADGKRLMADETVRFVCNKAVTPDQRRVLE